MQSYRRFYGLRVGGAALVLLSATTVWGQENTTERPSSTVTTTTTTTVTTVTRSNQRPFRAWMAAPGTSPAVVPNSLSDIDAVPGYSRVRRDRWMLGFGGFIPVGDLSEAADSRVGGSVQIGYEIWKPRPGRPFTVALFYQGAAITRSLSTQNGEKLDDVFSIHGGGVEATLYLAPGQSFNPYFGGGFGFFRISRKQSLDRRVAFFGSVFNNASVTSSHYYRPGLKAVAGLEIGRGYFAEARYLNAGSLDGIRFEGVSASVGLRY